MTYPFDNALSAMLRVAPVSMAVFDKEMIYLYHTQKWVEDYDLSPQNLVGLSHFDAFPESDEQWVKLHRRALMGESFSASADPFKCADGTTKFIQWEIAPWHDDSKNIGGITIVKTDVTQEQKRKQALVKANERFERAAQAGKIGVFEYNRVKDSFYLNTVGLELSTISPLEFDKIDLDAFKSRIEPRSTAKFDRFLVNCLTSKRSLNVVLDMRARDGSPFTIQVHGQVLTESGVNVGVAGVFTEISEQLRLAAETENALLEAETSYEELRAQQVIQQRMFAVIGHELRTPAAAIKMMIDQDETLEQSEYSETLSNTVNQLLNVLNELRSLVQPAEVQLASRQKSSPYDVVREVVTSMEEQFKSASIEMHFTAHEQSHSMCEFNANGLRKIVKQLLENVLAHSKANKVWVRIGAVTRKLTSEKMWVQLKVSDDGTGVPKEHRQHLFEPFYRIDDTQSGIGLGLHVCQRVAQSLGGVINYEDREGGGARFVLRMTLDVTTSKVQKPAKVFERMPMKLDFTREDSGIKGLYILLAEDNKTIQVLSKAMLMKAGAKVALASNGKQALQMFANNNLFDMVLTDIFMPEMDGYELTRRLREEGYKRPIIGITAASLGDEMQRLMDAGANAVLPKPMSIEKLIETVDRISVNEDIID